MVKTTKAQRQAIKRKADQAGLPYRAIRRNIHATFGMDGAIVLNWIGIWLCIETDGYCHS